MGPDTVRDEPMTDVSAAQVNFEAFPLIKSEGDIDPHARLAQLHRLISGGFLSIAEHRYLKILLSRYTIDVISELPIELVEKIALLLDLRDFVACLAVSRQWRDKLLSDSVLGAVVNKSRPSLVRASGDIQVTKHECLQNLHMIGRARWSCFQTSLAKPFTWEHESYFRLDPSYHGNHEDTLAVYAQFSRIFSTDTSEQAYWNALYAHGKIAWRPKCYTVVVDCLWSKTRKIFEVPNGHLISPFVLVRALGDRLLVCVLDRRLLAWDHVANVFLEKQVPGPVKDVTTEGLRVAVILYSGDVFIWEFGGKLSVLPTAPLISYHGFDADTLVSWESNMVVIFHPTCCRTLFLASGYTTRVDSKTLLKRVVYEFKDGNHIETFEIGIPPKTNNMADPRDVSLAIRKVLPYRRDIIGFCERYPPPEEGLLPPYETFVEFDIYDRKFSARIDEEFNHAEFGWRIILEDADLDFLVRFYDNGFSVSSYRPGFEFRIGE
ncbi:hypothetical protein AAE478_005800 [Parahypoxylon ruwenzoriense]